MKSKWQRTRFGQLPDNFEILFPPFVSKNAFLVASLNLFENKSIVAVVIQSKFDLLFTDLIQKSRIGQFSDDFFCKMGLLRSSKS